MKEKIYTIPINEAFDTDCECPFCLLERNLETDSVEYALGAAMMEPDNRMESNDKGFCSRHFKMLYEYPNHLGLALVLETHLEEIRKKLSQHCKKISNSSGGLFKKNQSKAAAELCETLSGISRNCVICEKIDYTMKRYASVTLQLWTDEPVFRKKFESSKGVCLKHFEFLCSAAQKELSYRQADAFISFLYEKERKELERIQNDIHNFTLKFDYRNTDMPWGTAKDAPIRCVEKINGYITISEEKES